MKVHVLGCGPSSSVPDIRCLLNGVDCHVCQEAYTDPSSKNNRGNPSILLHDEETQTGTLIDCGKTFRQSTLKQLSLFQNVQIEHILLTHDHADACLGLDDIRDLQDWRQNTNISTGEVERHSASTISVHCNEMTMKSMQQKFHYLFPKEKKIEENSNSNSSSIYRWVAELEWKIFENVNWRHHIITACPVWHGDDYISLGYEIITKEGHRFVYLSDVSTIPKETEEKIISGKTIKVLMIDCLSLAQTHGTHLNMKQAIDIVRRWKPEQTYLTGMGHSMDYSTVNTTLLKEELHIEMAYDGMSFSV